MEWILQKYKVNRQGNTFYSANREVNAQGFYLLYSIVLNPYNYTSHNSHRLHIVKERLSQIF